MSKDSNPKDGDGKSEQQQTDPVTRSRSAVMPMHPVKSFLSDLLQLIDGAGSDLFLEHNPQTEEISLTLYIPMGSKYREQRARAIALQRGYHASFGDEGNVKKTLIGQHYFYRHNYTTKDPLIRQLMLAQQLQNKGALASAQADKSNKSKLNIQSLARLIQPAPITASTKDPQMAIIDGIYTLFHWLKQDIDIPAAEFTQRSPELPEIVRQVNALSELTDPKQSDNREKNIENILDAIANVIHLSSKMLDDNIAEINAERYQELYDTIQGFCSFIKDSEEPVFSDIQIIAFKLDDKINEIKNMELFLSIVFDGIRDNFPQTPEKEIHTIQDVFDSIFGDKQMPPAETFEDEIAEINEVCLPVVKGREIRSMAADYGYMQVIDWDALIEAFEVTMEQIGKIAEGSTAMIYNNAESIEYFESVARFFHTLSVQVDENDLLSLFEDSEGQDSKAFKQIKEFIETYQAPPESPTESPKGSRRR